MKLPLLYELQDLQREMGIVEKKLKELRESTSLKKLKDEYQRLKEEYQKGEEKLRRNSYQQETKVNEIKNLENNKKASEEIKFSRETNTVKKLENIEKQLEALEEKKQAAEDNVITLINEADNINNELTETKKRLAFIKKKYLSNKESTEKAILELEAQRSELSPRIDSLISGIDKESYEIYNRILKAHPDPVARVENRICSGCKMGVSAMEYEALKSGSQSLRCQSCGRLLYFCNP